MLRKGIIGVLALLAAVWMPAAAAASRTVVTGRVTLLPDGEPVAGAAVSDGERIVQTDADGRYALRSDLRLGYVFLSVPDGYEVPADGATPRHFVHVDADRPTADFTLVRAAPDARYRLLVCNDIHLAGRAAKRDLEQFREGFVADVLRRREEFAEDRLYVLALGDMTTDKWWYRTGFALPEYLKEMQRTGLPVFHAMGNHDNDLRGGGGDLASSGAFRRVLGPAYYSFDMGGVHVVVLDDIVYDNPVGADGEVKDYNAYKIYVDPVQLRWLRRDLALVDRSTPLLVCTHAPFYRYKGLVNGKPSLREGFSKDTYSVETVIGLLRPFRQVTLLSGHTHLNYNVQIEPHILEHNNVSVCGSAWNTEAVCGINFCRDGTPAGYTVYTLAAGEVSWHYQPVGTPWRQGQLRAYDLNSIPASQGGEPGSNAVLVNVFNWDEQWSVHIREQGRELRVERVWARDPLYCRAAAGTALEKAPSLRPTPSPHLFRAVAATADAPVEIEVRDRFGNTFRRTLVRPQPIAEVTRYDNDTNE